MYKYTSNRNPKTQHGLHTVLRLCHKIKPSSMRYLGLIRIAPRYVRALPTIAQPPKPRGFEKETMFALSLPTLSSPHARKSVLRNTPVGKDTKRGPSMK